MKTYTYNINPGTAKFDDFKSKSTFIDDYTRTSSKPTYVYNIQNTRTYEPSWPAPEKKTTKYVYNIAGAPANTNSTTYGFYDITDIISYSKKYDDYEFFTEDGEKITIFDNFVKIGFNIIPTSKFSGFSIFKKKPAKKEITITFNIK